jgi:uncharacterized protein (TIGR02246 family)
MPRLSRVTILFVLCGCFASWATPRAQRAGSVDTLLEELVALERSALDRWTKLDPDGFLDLYSPEISYFDPTTEARVNGRQAIETRLAPMRTVKLPFTNPRYEIVQPAVQRHGDVAVLTFNLVNYGTPPGRPETVVSRWNSTEVYRRVEGAWKIIHSHWSFTRPELKQPGAPGELHVGAAHPLQDRGARAAAIHLLRNRR